VAVYLYGSDGKQGPRIARLDAEQASGVQRSESVLHMRVEETNPFKVELAFNNYQSPTVGAERGLVTLVHQSLTGHGSGVDRSHRGSGAYAAFSFQRWGGSAGKSRSKP
jgi:hemolysin activation/secretion protein